MKYLVLICFLIVCASVAKSKRTDGLQGRYDVPPGASVPSDGDDGTNKPKPGGIDDLIKVNPEDNTNPKPNPNMNSGINETSGRIEQPNNSNNENTNINDNESEDDPCLCVPYYLCKSGNIITDGEGLIDPRKKTSKTEIPLDKRLAGPSCGDYHVCCSDPERKPLDNRYPHRCGVRNPNGLNRRALSANESGEAEFGEWPFIATILEIGQDKSDYYFKSGAVLISEIHLLTTAHTVSGLSPQNLVVRLGEWDTQTTSEFLPHADYQVQDIKLHEKFISTNLHNDIAIVTLAKKVKFEPNIDSVCLPRETEQCTSQKGVVLGWGKKEFRGGSYSNKMKEVSLPLVPFNQCQEALRTTRLGKRFKLHPSFICAGGEAGKDSCKGDGGGPLVCHREDNSYAVVGLVSWGIDCGSAGIPGVYTNIKMYLEWIQKNVGSTIDIRSLQGN